MKEILVVDNHDSFVYNLVELLHLHCEHSWCVRRPEELGGVKATDFRGILLSPGPGLPDDVPAMMRLIAEADAAPSSICPSILGICLGHQAIGLYYGARLIHLPAPKHGHKSTIERTSMACPIWHRMDGEIGVGRYHSWALSSELPDVLAPTAFAKDDGCLMSIRHRERPFFGLQFHPESIISERGEQYVINWINTINELRYQGQ